jgi:hypothetical protein
MQRRKFIKDTSTVAFRIGVFGNMRISSIGQQDLITQIYFPSDPYLESDPSTKSALAVNRILSIRKLNGGESKIRFDIVLKKEYVPNDAVFHKVSGVYNYLWQKHLSGNANIGNRKNKKASIWERPSING